MKTTDLFGVIAVLGVLGFMFTVSVLNMKENVRPFNYLDELHFKGGTELESHVMVVANSSAGQPSTKLTEFEFSPEAKNGLREACCLIHANGDGKFLANRLDRMISRSEISKVDREHIHRVRSLVRAVKRLVDRGELGEVCLIDCELVPQFDWSTIPSELSPFIPVAKRFGVMKIRRVSMLVMQGYFGMHGNMVSAIHYWRVFGRGALGFLPSNTEVLVRRWKEVKCHPRMALSFDMRPRMQGLLSLPKILWCCF